jgi:uncharacterized protein YbgA (DUF1722 family)
MAHTPMVLRKLGSLVAKATKRTVREINQEYLPALMESLRYRSTVKKNVNVLFHALGYFKRVIDSKEKQEMLAIIEQYRNGTVPRVVPLTLLTHYIKKYEQNYLAQQFYFDPYPLDLVYREPRSGHFR